MRGGGARREPPNPGQLRGRLRLGGERRGQSSKREPAEERAPVHLLDDLVGSHEQRLWEGEIECLRGLEVDD